MFSIYSWSSLSQWTNQAQTEVNSYITYPITFNHVLRLISDVSGASITPLEYMVVTNIEMNKCRCWGVELHSSGNLFYEKAIVIPWLFIIGI